MALLVFSVFILDDGSPYRRLSESVTFCKRMPKDEAVSLAYSETSVLVG